MPLSGHDAPWTNTAEGMPLRIGDGDALGDCGVDTCRPVLPGSSSGRFNSVVPNQPCRPHHRYSLGSPRKRPVGSPGQAVPQSVPAEVHAIVRPSGSDPHQQTAPDRGPNDPPDARPGWRWESGSLLPHPARWFALPVAMVVAVYGYTPLTPMGLNALYAALATLLTYSIVRTWGDRRAARLACLVVGFWPSLGALVRGVSQGESDPAGVAVLRPFGYRSGTYLGILA